MPEPEEAPTGRARLRDAMLRPSRSQVIVAVLLAVVGFAGIVQVRTTAEDDTYSGYREQDLIDLLAGIAGTTQRAEDEIARLEQARDDLRSTTTARTTALEEARRQARALEVLAGTVPVTGPGIRVTIEEDEGEVDAADVVDMVQELRVASAEAIEINDSVRLVASSWIDSAGGGDLLVDGVVLSPPFVVEVIGQPATLAGAMSFPEGPTTQLTKDEAATVQVDELESIEVTAVRDPDAPSFAEPAG
ncbi:DUF881 domain-containing protein [Nocardioides zeae]|uniref:DUF881 domain-containing protein n=1 Tax=Nocardioides imazamoxiresistens TaxID=3231893 RepID=A0ABU3PUC7_9ACTN|nr:DUF881 domain-containing protein [Nocardioides zeae]MDT9592395.1 DUF881 domain-containing protein [Nocardioides zeae]